MSKALMTCPHCGGRFEGVTITDRAIVCQGCQGEMLTFRREGQTLTRCQLWATLDSERVLLIKRIKPWMPPEHRDAAPVLLGYLFSQIADTLPED